MGIQKRNKTYRKNIIFQLNNMNHNTEIFIKGLSLSDLKAVIDYCKAYLLQAQNFSLEREDIENLYQIATNEMQFKLYTVFQNDPMFKS